MQDQAQQAIRDIPPAAKVVGANVAWMVPIAFDWLSMGLQLFAAAAAGTYTWLKVYEMATGNPARHLFRRWRKNTPS